MPEVGPADASVPTRQRSACFGTTTSRLCSPAVAGNPAVVGHLPLDRWLCVTAFRRFCPCQHGSAAPAAMPDDARSISSSVPFNGIVEKPVTYLSKSICEALYIVREHRHHYGNTRIPCRLIPTKIEQDEEADNSKLGQRLGNERFSRRTNLKQDSVAEVRQGRGSAGEPGGK